MAKLWAMTTTFDSLSIGDVLPILVKWETEQSINRFQAPLKPGEGLPASVGESAETETNEDRAVFERALAAYVPELLEKGFPITHDQAAGSILNSHTHGIFNPGDIISLSGRVVDKRLEGDRRLVACEIIVENQASETIATATAAVAL